MNWVNFVSVKYLFSEWKEHKIWCTMTMYEWQCATIYVGPRVYQNIYVVLGFKDFRIIRVRDQSIQNHKLYFEYLLLFCGTHLSKSKFLLNVCILQSRIMINSFQEMYGPTKHINIPIKNVAVEHLLHIKAFG